MEQNATLEAMKQYIAYYQQIEQVEPSMIGAVFFVAVVIFSGIGIIASVRFVYRFVKNGFKLKAKPVTTRYVFVDSYVGVAFLATILAFFAAFVVRAIAAGKGGF
jgi:hypothetical protein